MAPFSWYLSIIFNECLPLHIFHYNVPFIFPYKMCTDVSKCVPSPANRPYYAAHIDVIDDRDLGTIAAEDSSNIQWSEAIWTWIVPLRECSRELKSDAILCVRSCDSLLGIFSLYYLVLAGPGNGKMRGAVKKIFHVSGFLDWIPNARFPRSEHAGELKSLSIWLGSYFCSAGFNAIMGIILVAPISQWNYSGPRFL